MYVCVSGIIGLSVLCRHGDDGGVVVAWSLVRPRLWKLMYVCLGLR